MSLKSILPKSVFCVSILALTARIISPAYSAETYLSPYALAADKDGRNIYIAEYTGKKVAVFDVAGAKVAKTIDLKEEASGVALSPDGALIAATGAAPDGKVYLIDAASGSIKDTLSAGHTPMAPVFSPNSKTLYVCNRFNDDVSVFDLASKKETARIKVKREPVAAVLTADGKFLFVANLLLAGSLEGDYAAATISVIDTSTLKEVTAIGLPNGSSSVHGICLSPDGQYVYATHVLSRYQLPTTQLERGWMNTNGLSVIDVASKKLVNTVLLDNVDLGAANPWGVACTADGRFVCVTHAGTQEVNVIERAAMHEKLAKAAKGEKVSEATSSANDVPNDLSFLVGMRRRLKLQGNGARGLVLIGNKAYAAEYFTDSLGVVDIAPDSRPNAKSMPVGPQTPMT
ncbi:MAG: YncE family protein, partial [Candidatus Sumerlaeota bacterium]|nr:YncE family protein [Candidatus Sumerlaeota bacterium]